MGEIKKKDPGGLDISKLRVKREQDTLSTGEIINKLKSSSGRSPSLQVVMMFDITGSMFQYFNEIRKKLREIVLAVKKESPNSEFSVFAYRNNGDTEYDQIYYTFPLTSNLKEILENISGIRKGGGKPDWLTCMENCLWKANRLLWSTSSPKAIVVIGDMPPHGVVDSKFVYNEIDYEQEIEYMKKIGVKIYSVFCPSDSPKAKRTREFYQWMAQHTRGRFLEISEIDILAELLIAICMKETGNLSNYLKGSRAKGLTENTRRAIRMLTEGDDK